MLEAIYRICRICISYMHQHPEKYKWLKCPSCGFSKVMKQVITLEMYWMGRDEQFKDELTQEIKDNATILLEKVNALLNDLQITSAKVSSGWRPIKVNASVLGAAKKSSHQIGKALDILDSNDQILAKKILDKKDLLEKYDLYLESPDHTKGQYTNWVHLQTTKTKSGNRIFIP